jgi:hypothetical protein
MEVRLHSFLILALDRDKRSALLPGHFAPEQTAPQTLSRPLQKEKKNHLFLPKTEKQYNNTRSTNEMTRFELWTLPSRYVREE